MAEAVIKEAELLRLRPGDILVLRVEDDADPASIQGLAMQLKLLFTKIGLTGVEGLVLQGGKVEFKIVRSAEWEGK